MEFSNLPTVVKRFNLNIEEKYKRVIIKNLIIAICFILYLFGLNILSNYDINNYLIYGTKAIATIVFAFSIFGFEKAYKKTDFPLALLSCEFTCFSFLILKAVFELEYFQKRFYIFILYSCAFVCIYYFIKIFIYYTKAAKNKLYVVSDIKDIVKNEPIKNVAIKHHKNENLKDETISRLKDTIKNDQESIKKSNINQISNSVDDTTHFVNEKLEEEINLGRRMNKKARQDLRNTSGVSNKQKNNRKANTSLSETDINDKTQNESILDQSMSKKKKTKKLSDKDLELLNLIDDMTQDSIENKKTNKINSKTNNKGIDKSYNLNKKQSNSKDKMEKSNKTNNKKNTKKSNNNVVRYIKIDERPKSILDRKMKSSDNKN